MVFLVRYMFQAINVIRQNIDSRITIPSLTTGIPRNIIRLVTLLTILKSITSITTYVNMPVKSKWGHYHPSLDISASY